VAVIAAAAPPRIRAQTFSCFGLALSVCGAASAPILIGLLSDTLQSNGFSAADALRWSMCGLVAVVMGLGTFLIVQASRHADADVHATITEFLESYNAPPA
jgi:MFS family permease